MSAAPQSTDTDLTNPQRAALARLSAFEPQERAWYGWQTLISDAVSLSVTTVGLTLSVGGVRAPDDGIARSPWFLVGGGLSLMWIGMSTSRTPIPTPL